MKTYNKEDLITWANCDKAVIGNEYYFASSLDTMEHNVEKGVISQLINIDKDDYACTFKGKDHLWYACILPVDAVKENKTYRACRNVKELYELVFNTKSKADTEFYINELVGTVIHFKWKGFDTTYYKCISGIVVYINSDIAVHIGVDNFELDELFKSYEIEINGEWQPFGVEE